MIHRCRPDFDAISLWRELRRAQDWSIEPDSDLAILQQGNRSLFHVPSAREGIRWFLGKAGIGDGDEVALPTLCCEVVADSILACGATPVAYGVTEGFSPSVDDCAKSLSAATRAIIVPHLYGIPADLSGFRDLCKKKGLLFIEDCAPCVTGESRSLRVGEVGDCAVYSFKYDKPLALGWGGALTLSNEMINRLGEPHYPTFSDDLDLAVAASLAIQHALTDSNVYNSFLGMGYALNQILSHADLVEGVVKMLDEVDNPTRLVDWWRSMLPGRRTNGNPSICASLTAWLKRAARVASRRVIGRFHRRISSPPDAVSLRLGGETLPVGGLCHRIIRAQAMRLGDTISGQHRRNIGMTFAANLSQAKFLLPDLPDSYIYLLRFPVAMRENVASRDRIVRYIGEHLHVEIGPYNWIQPVHRIPRFQGRVRASVGAVKSERLVAGLMNLPVHAQVSEGCAVDLAHALNQCV